MPREGNDARPFIISLDGWAGTQRYAGIWTGDQTGGDWEYIRYHIPTFVNRGNEFLLDENSDTLFVLKFRAKKNGTFALQPIDGMLVDRNLSTTAF